MPDKNGHLYLFEALELRDEYDRRIRTMERLLKARETGTRRGFAASLREDEELRPVPGFEPERIEADLKKLKTRRLKLNQAVQATNFHAEIRFESEGVNALEALELRKALLAEVDQSAERVVDAAYEKILHKEKRDIVKSPPHGFEPAFAEYHELLGRLRRLVTAIHTTNHTVTVPFRDE